MSAELVAANPRTLDQLAPAQREASVTRYLSDARDRLALAVAATGPEAVAKMKAEIATVAEATKQLGLSKEIRDDAAEMVRRAEYALGKSILKGQAEGTVETISDARSRAGRIVHTSQHPDENGVLKTPLSAVVTPDEMTANGAGIAHLSDGVSESEFEQALSEARREGNLSRANVVRKVRQQPRDIPSRGQKADLLADLAAQGYTSRQACGHLGFSRSSAVRELAKEYGIDIPADRVTARSRHINSDRILNNVAESVEAAAYSIQQIDPSDLDQDDALERIDSLIKSLKTLSKATNKIKESLHG